MVQVCGPIVEVVDGYVQFVHFTVREYVFNSKVEGSISLPDMALDLALRCITYLCQDHHYPSLTEDDIDAKILWGAYRLHNFSSRFWLHLINQYLILSDAVTLPASLIDMLRLLLDTRSSESYIDTDRGETTLHPAIIELDSQEPDLVEMLRNATDFQLASSKPEYHLDKSNPKANDLQDTEDVQPLLFDLIESNQIELAISAASIGSFSILKLFMDCDSLSKAFIQGTGMDWKRFENLCSAAMTSVGTSKVLLSWVPTLLTRVTNKGHFALAVKIILTGIIARESQDLFDLWKSKIGSAFGIDSTVHLAAKGSAFQGVIGTTENVPNRERMLIAFWEEFKMLDLVREGEGKNILASIASTTRSINLAQHVLNYGYKVDDRYGATGLPALRIAARKDTQEAADLMEFLLLHGANPNGGTAKKRIAQEVGAQRISRWLDVTWEGLVERTEKKRKKYEDEDEDRFGKRIVTDDDFNFFS
ncbi:hypothetical protein F53441_8222 [Fusarium austroafricanum]|uniref:Ankyrin repeat protein n=1 Tax=Fusarium austroafricanum TaxID=2364996 RepID=A0A8H4KER0_9HYPO|nr:hypothetical protein F53441_8222 [Fusarium austroafricanum]